jgi:hypothetical protein
METRKHRPLAGSTPCADAGLWCCRCKTPAANSTKRPRRAKGHVREPIDPHAPKQLTKRRATAGQDSSTRWGPGCG